VSTFPAPRPETTDPHAAIAALYAHDPYATAADEWTVVHELRVAPAMAEAYARHGHLTRAQEWGVVDAVHAVVVELGTRAATLRRCVRAGLAAVA